jgi:hypothetical protein
MVLRVSLWLLPHNAAPIEFVRLKRARQGALIVLDQNSGAF